MSDKPRVRRSFRSEWDEINYLYDQLLYWFYGQENRARCYPYAFRLQRLLQRADPKAEALLGMDARAIMAELAGDHLDAARYRRKAVRALARLHERGELESVRLGPDDISDRLDLMAIHYWNAGRPRKALHVLGESEAFCAANGIPFDGGDIRDEITAELAREGRSARPAKTA